MITHNNDETALFEFEAILKQSPDAIIDLQHQMEYEKPMSKVTGQQLHIGSTFFFMTARVVCSFCLFVVGIRIIPAMGSRRSIER